MDAFEALADPVRRTLLLELVTSPARVVDLADTRPISRPAVSRHLRVLSEAGLVTVAARGRERHYGVDPSGLAPVRDLLARLDPVPSGLLTRQALDALDTEVRRTSRERRTHSRPHSQEETA